MTAPRVLVSAIALDQPMGGVRRQAAELWPRVAEALLAGGGGLDFLAPENGLPPDLDARLPAACRRIATHVPAHGPFARSLHEGRALRRALRDHGPYALWHTGHFPAPRATGLPFTCLIHDLRSLNPRAPALKRLIAKPILRSAFTRAARVVTVSQAMVVELHHHFPRLRATAIPHGADHLPVLPRSPGPDAPLLFFGHLERRRNPELLLHALAADPALPDVHFVGRPKDDEAERLDAIAHQLGVANRIALRGPIDEAELPALFANAACLVLPSLIEGFGLPAIEALRAGLPLAIANTPALVEATPATTPTFAPDDGHACAAAITTALHQPATTLAAARTFAERYSWNASAARWVELWSELAN